MKTLYQNARVITDGTVKTASVLAEDGVILAVGNLPGSPADTVIDCTDKYLCPGFIDIHQHGGDGFEYIDGTPEAIKRAIAVHKAHGTRLLFPTLSAMSFPVLAQALAALEEVKKSEPMIGGVHLEGPYFSPAMAGAQDPNAIHAPREEEYKPLFERFGHLIVRWSYAPELDPDLSFLRFLNENGIIPAIAHSAATLEELTPAYEEGNRLITHLYSCTSTIVREKSYRKLGIVEAAYLYDDMFAEAIADGKHLPLPLIKMIYKLKGPDRVCLVTDAIRPAGMAKPVDGISGATPYIVEDGVAKLADRSAFAGSIATSDRLLATAVSAGIPLADAVRMLTETPAKVMRVADMGRVAPGYRALFTMLDEELHVIG